MKNDFKKKLFRLLVAAFGIKCAQVNIYLVKISTTQEGYICQKFISNRYRFSSNMTLLVKIWPHWLRRYVCSNAKSVFVFRKKPIIWVIIRFLAIKMIKFSILISGDDGKITFWSLLALEGWRIEHIVPLNIPLINFTPTFNPFLHPGLIRIFMLRNDLTIALML